MIDRFKGSRSDYWNTPKKLYIKILSLGYIDYNPENSYIDPFNSKAHLFRNQKVFINPPFSILNKPEWINTVKGLLQNQNEVLLLLPARTDTKQFHELLKLDLYVHFIKGRLKYNDSNPAPFPSLWLYSDFKIKIKELENE
mgnify:CR=1 FL=1